MSKFNIFYILYVAHDDDKNVEVIEEYHEMNFIERKNLGQMT